MATINSSTISSGPDADIQQAVKFSLEKLGYETLKPIQESGSRIPQWKSCFCLLTNQLWQVSLLCMLDSCFWLHERERRIDSNMCVAVDVVDDRPESQVCTKGAIGGVCWRDAVWPTSPGQHPWRQGAVAVYKSSVHSFKSPVGEICFVLPLG